MISARIRHSALAVSQTHRLNLKEKAMTHGRLLRVIAASGVLFLCATSALTDEVRHLKLEEAVRLALAQNR